MESADFATEKGCTPKAFPVLSPLHRTIEEIDLWQKRAVSLKTTSA
jgi:hypothetical protein